MKMKLPHLVPLSEPAVALLRRLRTEHEALSTGSIDDRYLFSARDKAPLRDVTTLKATRIVSVRGAPNSIRVDNGPEFISKALDR